MKFVVLGIVVLVAGLGLWLFRRWRRKRAQRLISLVALLKEPTFFDPVVLAQTASRAWNADLGGGGSEGQDGFVTMTDIVGMIQHDGRFFLVNCRPHPYVDDPAEAAESIGDLRIRELFREHRAWFSFDAMGTGRTPTEDSAADYRQIARLLAEFLDENCLLIYSPELNRAWTINEDTQQALLADDPIAALQDTLTIPVTEISDDDPRMQEAVAKARTTWPEFVAAFESRTGENFSIKAPVSGGGNTEFIWITVTATEGDQIFGELANDPVNLGALRLGSKVVVKLQELNDWCYIDRQGNMQGCFTLAVLQKAARKR